MVKGFLWCLLPAFCALGCQRYEPEPLRGSAADQALDAAAQGPLRAKVAEFHHPLLPAVAIDLQEGLTPDSAAIIAVVVNPSLRAQRDRRSLASAQLLQARLLPNPTLDFTLDPVTGGNTAGALTAYSIGPTWEVTALIAHDAKVASARAASESVQLDVAWQEWQFAESAKKAVYDLVALQGQLAEATEVDARLREDVGVVRKAVDAHLKTVVDLAAADAASQKAHADSLGLRRDLLHQQLILSQSLGSALGAPVKISPSVNLPSELHLPPDEELLAGIEQRRLDILALRKGYESQEQTLRAAVLGQFPKIVFGVHQASDNTGVISTGVGLSVDLPIFDRNQGAIATQKATRQQLFDEYAARLFEARSAIALALSDNRSLAEQIAAAEAAIPTLEQLVKTYRVAVDQHNADVLSFYTAQNDLAQKRIEVFKLKQALMDNKIALEIAAGRYLPEPVSPSSAPATGPSAAATAGPDTSTSTGPKEAGR